MNLFTLAQAARRRVRAVRSGDQDSGFMLIYVLMITTIVTILVGSTLVITGNSIVPSVRSAYSQAADSAAQGGIQAFVAYADANCTDAKSSVDACTLPSNFSGVVKVYAKDGYTASYTWAAEKDAQNRYFRVRSTGTVVQGGVSSTKTVVADVAGGASTDILDYGVVVGFESMSSSAVLAQWPQRTITLDSTAIDAADVPVKGNSITWSGSSPGTAAGKVAICNATFEAKGGRNDNPPPQAPNPYVDWTESGLGGNNYTNYQPCQASWANQTKLLAPVNPADGLGGYYSNDALLLSNSYPGGSGPLFDQPVKSAWSYTQADAGQCGTVAGQNFRSFNLVCAGYPVEVGGTPSSSSMYPNVQSGPGPTTQTGSPAVPGTACVYNGPTRVKFTGDTAIVTSPQTTQTWVNTYQPTRPAQCYAGAGAQGMAAQTVSLTSPTVIRVLTADNDGKVPSTTPAKAHGSSGWPVTGQKVGDTASAVSGSSNSVFYTSVSAATAADTAAATAADSCSPTSTYTGSTASTDCQWSGTSDTAGSGWTPDGTGWTKFSSGTTCTTDPTDRLTFACDYNNGYGTGVYATYRATLKNSLAAASVPVSASGNVTVNGTSSACPVQTITPGTATGVQLACMVQDSLHVANTGGRQVGAGTAATGDHRYIVGAGATTTTTATVPVGSTPSTGMSGDPFFSSTAGTASTETMTTKTTTYTVGRQTYLSNSWGDGTTSGASTPAFQVTITRRAYSNFAQGTTAVSSFPSMADVTQYAIGGSSNSPSTFGDSGPGDLYVEGTVGHTMSVVAANDLVVTGSIAPADTGTQALQLVGRNDSRIYHPVKCKITDSDAIAATDPGFCPNDITGLYSSVLPNGTRPDQQYINLRPDLSGLTINAALFALGNSDGSITCPQPPDGGGVCGGDFTVDNYNRGAALGQLTEIGTLAMAHHAPVGQEWEIADTSGATSRPYSGYQLAQQYQNLKAAIKSVSDVSGTLQTSSSTTSLWHVVSVSTGKAS
jgi:hypothetical protein